jgi:hypothetical protein
VSDLVVRREHPFDVLILLCARLDALASDAVAEGTSSKQAFTKFVTTYAGHRDLFEAVSVPDLYHELLYHRWLMEGTVEKAGRLHRFSKVDDPILHLLEDAGLPLTLKDCERLLDTLMRLLAKNFRARPRQSLSRPRTVHPSRLAEIIEISARRTRLHLIASQLPKALASLFDSKRVSTVLYERFRCDSIHVAQIVLNQDRFFREAKPYWESRDSRYAGAYELIEFPAPLSSRMPLELHSQLSHASPRQGKNPTRDPLPCRRRHPRTPRLARSGTLAGGRCRPTEDRQRMTRLHSLWRARTGPRERRAD